LFDLLQVFNAIPAVFANGRKADKRAIALIVQVAINCFNTINYLKITPHSSRPN